MQYKLPLMLSLSLMTIGAATAQTVSTFENIVLPSEDTTYMETVSGPDGAYTFQSGNAKFYGKKDFGGSYYANFNCSNHTDTVTPGFGNMWSNIVGEGVNGSANYSMAYVETDYSTAAMKTVPVGVKLTGNAVGHQVAGAYFTNSVYAYRYILDGNYYDNGNHWFKLIVRGYSNGAKTMDSVVYTLADYSGAGAPVLVHNWQWVDLTALGYVDSLTFDLASSDAGSFGINTPSYFAMDNLTTLDGICPVPQHIAAVSINENSASIAWDAALGGLAAGYDVAVDQSATLAPTAASVPVSATSYTASSLNNNTTYYVHVRSSCGNAQFSPWDTASFKTLGNTGIFQASGNALNISLSPNPATDHITLQSGIAVDAIVYSIEGKEMLKATRAKTIDISTLPAGIYLLKATDTAHSGKQSTLRFTKY